ncbi:MAG: sensor histidine kinase [Slackia piriformis]|uniref:Sensor histidine kinase n=1 Tax=Slackia piriformis TaxID=626934 RepID=A0A943V168_9ACTN|nr:sensor histidine kinase [Slackia piriformis]
MSDLDAFIDKVVGPGRFRVEDDFGNGFVRLRVSEAERRQAKQDIRCVEDAVVEMLRNARDAHAKTIFLAMSRSGDRRTIAVIDDGDGIPSEMQDVVFEPRVTSKLDSFSEDEWGVHGRGMALYSIRENAEEARVCASLPGKGSALRVSFLVSAVKERKDQSTLPTLASDGDRRWILGPGPRNIARAAAEFALHARHRCTLYCGSPVEVAATLRAYGMRFSEPSAIGASPAEDAPFAARLSFCRDAVDFSSCAEKLGLSVSQRSAYRILQGDVSPLKPLLGILRDASSAPGSVEEAPFPRDCDARGLKIASDDRAAFVDALKKAWAPLAEAYYLDAEVEPSVRVSRDGVRVTFPACKQL